MKPTWEPLNLRCGLCGHEWRDWQPNGVAPSVWIAQIKSRYCPKCGRKRKLFILTRDPVASTDVDDGG